LRAIAGYNEPDVLIRRDVLGEKIAPGFSYREVTIMRSLSEHVVATGSTPDRPRDNSVGSNGRKEDLKP
jgi:carbamoyl-phosphate synthase large subunit